jgi:hypothetical protein
VTRERRRTRAAPPESRARRTASMPRIPESWKTSLEDSWIYVRLEALRVEGGGRLCASALARAWLPRLARLGLGEVEPATGAPPKDPRSWNPHVDPFRDEVRSASLAASRYSLLLKLNGPRSERGYRTVEVLEDLPRTDVAILAALTNLEASEVDVERLERALSLLKVPMQDYSQIESVFATLDKGSEGSSGHLAQTDIEEFRKLIADLQGWRTLEYVAALLRHYRPEFDNLPREEKHGLIVGCCRRVNALLEASKQLGAFLEYGAPDKDLRAPLEEVERYVRAAELKDVEGLSDRKIGEILGIEPAPSDEIRRQNSNVRHAVKQGKRLFTDAWGEEEWQKRGESKRNESEWFLSLTEEERHLVRFADAEGLSSEEAFLLAREMNEEEKEEQNSVDEPKAD